MTEHPRNTGDETIKAVADKGGVVGVYFMPFLRTDRKAAAEDVIAHVCSARQRAPQINALEVRKEFVRVIGLMFEQYLIEAVAAACGRVPSSCA